MEITNSRWARKIVALLHDPPDKALGIAGHKERARELQQIALGREATTEEARTAEQADQIASAADRVDFPEGSEAYWHTEKAVLIHPLAGRELDLGSLAVDTTNTHEAAKKVVELLVRDVSNGVQRFLRLWRCLTEQLAKEFPRVGTLFRMLPADTRQPDHPLTQHLSITAAIADALPQPALLAFSIGPVQEFIAAARRTQDLWMGSWLLSYLSWTAMKSLVEEYGPDIIVFPSLRGQPLCDLWLAQDKQVPTQKPRLEDLTLASLPNKFVALLPASEAKSAAGKAERAVRGEWKRLADLVLSALSNGIMPVDEQTQKMWENQVSTHLEVYWSILPWEGKGDGGKQAEAVKSLFEMLCAPPSGWRFGKAYALFARPKEEGGGQYHPNWGTTYSLLYSLTDRAFNARKTLRDFVPMEEKGEKCTVCGRRAALHGRDGSRQGVRKFWSRAASNLKAKDRYEVRLDGRERLCAICTVKRFIQREVLEGEIGLRGGFPSTSEISVASFKAAVLEKLKDPESGEKLANALSDYLEGLKRLGFPISVVPEAIPKLHQLRQQLSNAPQRVREYAGKLLGYDGEALFEDVLTVKRFKEEYGLSVSEDDIKAVRESLRRLKRVAEEADIPSPARYYAALMMDGDHAGQWLSGTHEGLTTFGDVLHPEVRKRLENVSGWKDLLKERRLMTPAVHAAISDALANFALKLVRFVVEERHCGRVVYAGGDDVLALLPLDEALPAARELRALFSGEVGFVESNLKSSEMDMRKQNWQVKFGDPTCTGYLWLDGAPLPTMGPAASASIGIAIAHHLQPLDTTLQAMREAERAAKETYDRNALCIHLLKRSGEEVRVGGRWFYESVPQDTVAMITDICKRFKSGQLAMKLAHVVFEEARTLSHLPKEAQQAELRRLLKRHSQRRMSDDEHEALAENLTVFASALNSHADKVGKRGFEQMAEWLLLARFLAMGGEV